MAYFLIYNPIKLCFLQILFFDQWHLFVCVSILKFEIGKPNFLIVLIVSGLINVAITNVLLDYDMVYLLEENT